ncbi:MAG TPA: hypothetical protein VJL35_01200 [Gemmatimonadaceae bacterium]|nr:hypothetical protein [Gemmatimonadaceae bacterium]
MSAAAMIEPRTSLSARSILSSTLVLMAESVSCVIMSEASLDVFLKNHPSKENGLNYRKTNDKSLHEALTRDFIGLA